MIKLGPLSNDSTMEKHIFFQQLVIFFKIQVYIHEQHLIKRNIRIIEMAETNDLMLLRYNTQNASHIKTLSPWHQKIIFWSNTLGFDLLGTDNSRKIPEVMEFTHN